MSTYYEKLRDPRWQKRRLEIMKRDGFACRDCAATDKTLNVHHCHYAKTPWEADERALLTVCEDCHSDRQKKEDLARSLLGVIIARMGNGPDDGELGALCLSLSDFASDDQKQRVFVVWDHNDICRLSHENTQLILENEALKAAAT